MSDVKSIYSFLPWLRQGVSNKIDTDDNDPSVKLRASIDITLSAEGKGLDENVSEEVARKIGLYGPGDIVGLDPSTIIKTEPLNQITNFEPNYLASIEFYEEDLPWRYTPAKPDAKGHLRPWLTLVVLKESEFTEGNNSDGKPLPYIELQDVPDGVFQPADQLWAWAHVHVNGDIIKSDIQTTSADGADYIENVKSEINDGILDEYQSILNSDPDLAYSRIVCPRRLTDNEGYHAFLIPTFESGRLAGLGKDVEATFLDEAATVNATTSAWESYDGKEDSTLIPFYHRWYFRTGNTGDFEYLVKLLEAKPVDSRVGNREMDVSSPGSNLAGITDEPEDGVDVPELGGILKLGGALRIPEETLGAADLAEVQKYDNWDAPYPREFQKELAAFLNLSEDFKEKTPKEAMENSSLPEGVKAMAAADDDPDPIITAPLYGKWHALTQRLLDDDDGIPNDNWLHELNLDPRYRVPAGFGTGVVQKNQEAYMSAAWEQVGDIVAANYKINQAHLAQSASKYWYASTLKSMYNYSPGSFLWLTQPVQARILSVGLTLEGTSETLTVKHQVKESKVPSVIFSSPFRKFIRPNARLDKEIGLSDNAISLDTLIERINTGEIVASQPKKEPEGVNTVEDLAGNLEQEARPKSGLLEWLSKNIKQQKMLLVVALVAVVLALITLVLRLPLFFPAVFIFVALICIYLYLALRRITRKKEAAESIKIENQTEEAVDALPDFPTFTLSPWGTNVSFIPGVSDSAEAERFKLALKDVSFLLADYALDAIELKRPALDLETIAAATLRTLDPAVSIPNYVNAQIYLPDHIKVQLSESFKMAMAYPEFDVPMYKPLLDISADLFLPNINYIEQNSISLLETNQKFIEAYMVGLNHEFGRELLWREYPTDQRGSYFRQFWDVTNYYDPDSEDAEALKEELKDIPELHLWSKYSELGDHDNREKEGDNEQEIVLVIRGELLKRYPNAVIYAHKAQWKAKEGTTDEPDKDQERELVAVPESQEGNPPRTIIQTPLYEAKADPDIYFFGFDLTALEARGMADDEEPETLEDDAGWFFVIKERPGEPRFGLDIGGAEDGELEVWNDLGWDNVTPAVAEDAFLQISAETESLDVGTNPLEDDDDEKLAQREEDTQITWNKDMNAAELAYILFQAPVMVAVHGAEMLPDS